MKTHRKTSWLVLGLVAVILLQSMMAGVMAESQDDPLKELQTSTTEQKEISISFKLGSNILTINGNQVTVETPVEINGTTLVPLRVISEAFGAQVEWNGEDESVTLTYSGIVIRVWIGKKDCLVGGQQAVLLEAPILQNDTTMVPLRFISENFGADVGYDGETEQVTVVKKVANDNSVKDFAMILKKSTKESVGDSFYGWSMKMPKKYALAYRNFNGSENIFQTSDEKESILLSIMPMLENETVESQTKALMDSFSQFVLQDKETKTINGVKMNRMTYKDGEDICIIQLGVKDDSFVLLFYNNNDIKQFNAQKQEILSVIDSFSFGYTNDSAVEDLSDVNTQGLREYQNKDYGVRLGVFPDWFDFSDKENHMIFGNLTGKKNVALKSFRVAVTSAESGLTVENWAKQSMAENEKMFNSKYITVSESTDVTNQSGTWKMATVDIQAPDFAVRERQYFQIRDGYKYFIGCSMQQEGGKVNSLPIEEIDKMFASLQLQGVDKETVGKILDEDLLDEEITYRTVTGDAKWSAEIPDEWEKIPSDSVEIYGKNDATMNSIGVSAQKEDVSYSQVVRAYDQYVKDMVKAEGYKDLSMSDSKLGGVSCRKYTMIQDSDGDTLHYEMYVTMHNGKIYILTAIIRDLYASEYNLSILHKVVESFKFTD